MKKQTNEDAYEQYSFEALPDSFVSVEMKKEKRQKMVEKRRRLANEIRKLQEIDEKEKQALAANFENTLKQDKHAEQTQKTNPFGISARNPQGSSPIIGKDKSGQEMRRGLTQTKSPKTKSN